MENIVRWLIRFLGTEFVQLKQSILTKNDKCKICRGPFGLFKFEKKGGQPSIGTDEQWGPTSKKWKIPHFLSWGLEYERGAPDRA